MGCNYSSWFSWRNAHRRSAQSHEDWLSTPRRSMLIIAGVLSQCFCPQSWTKKKGPNTACADHRPWYHLFNSGGFSRCEWKYDALSCGSINLSETLGHATGCFENTAVGGFDTGLSERRRSSAFVSYFNCCDGDPLADAPKASNHLRELLTRNRSFKLAPKTSRWRPPTRDFLCKDVPSCFAALKLLMQLL